MGDKWRRELCRQLCEKQGWRCYYCEGWMLKTSRFPQSPAYPSLERLEEGSIGGGYVEGNVVASCRECNHNRPDLEHDQWLILRRSLVSEWPPCQKMPKELRKAINEKFGYAQDMTTNNLQIHTQPPLR